MLVPFRYKPFVHLVSYHLLLVGFVDACPKFW